MRTLAYRHRPRLWRTALLRADALVASSRFEREFWIGQGAPPERIAVVPPLSVASAGPLGVEPSGAARPGARRLLYIGGWDDANGASLLAGALDLLRQPVTVIAAGQSGAAAQAALRTAIGRRHRVEFSGDAGSLQPLLAACDAAVVPARWSASFSLLIREAQLAGIPVVASAVGGLSEQIIHGVNGYLAAASDFESLAESLEDALSPPSVYFDPAAASRNARRLEHASAASLERLLALLSSPASQAEAALTLEHGDWLEAAAPAYGVSPSDAARQLVAALRLIHDPGLGDADPDSALALACVQRAASTLRQHTLDLNHAIAFFRACGCRRICALAPGLDTDTLTLFADWNLDAVPATELPDGLWAPLDANSTPALLRRRHPQALALVRQTPAGLETLDWRD